MKSVSVLRNLIKMKSREREGVTVTVMVTASFCFNSKSKTSFMLRTTIQLDQLSGYEMFLSQFRISQNSEKKKLH